MNIINTCIKNSIQHRKVVLIITAILIAISLFTIKKTPVDAIPDLSDVQVIIKTAYPGQAPQIVQDQITYPITTSMLAVPKSTVVRGFSYFGVSYVYILFEEGTDIYWARSRVLEYLNQNKNQLPEDAKPELGPDATGVGWIYQYALIDKSGRHDLAELTSLQNWHLRFALQSVPGVAEVATIGGMVKQYQVILKPNRLRAYRLSVPEVQKAIKASNHESGASVIELSEAEYMIRTHGYIKSIHDLEQIPIKLNKNGVPVLLKDIASIKLGFQMRRGLSDFNGEGETTGGIIVMRHHENALEVIHRVKEKLSSLERSLPKGVEIVETYNRAKLIKGTIQTLKYKLFEEFFLVFLVCALFLNHLRGSLIVLLTLPLAILASLLVMYYQGINANIMSLGGIAIAISAMDDAVIVFIENYYRKLEKFGPSVDKWQLVKEACFEVGPPIFISLLVITLSFMPIFTLQGQEGKLFAPLAYTKTYAMAAVAILAITVIPILIGYLITPKNNIQHESTFNKSMRTIYQSSLAFALNRPYTIIFSAVALSILSLIPFKYIGSEFMPDLNEGDLMYMPTTFPSISIGKAQQLLQQTDRLIKTTPEVKTVHGKIGRAETATDPAPLSMIETIIQLKDKAQWRPGMTLQKIKQELDQKIQFPGLTNAWVMPIKTRIDMLTTGIKTPVGIKIMGADLKEIQRIGKNIETILKKQPGTSSVFAERVQQGRYIHIKVNRTQAARYGLNIKEIHNNVQYAVGGSNISQSTEGLERYPINMRYPLDFRNSLDKIKNLPIITNTGAHIPLKAVAEIKIEYGPAMIKSENAKLIGQVLIDLDEHTDIGSYVQAAQKALMGQMKIPPGYTLIWSGQFEYMNKAMKRLKVILPLTAMIIFLLMFIHFNQLSIILMICCIAPMALSGSIILLYLLNYNLSIAVIVGFIALLGVSVELAVVMLSYLNMGIMDQKEKKNQTLSKQHIKETILESASQRLRPILMTVMTIVFGLLPVMIGKEIGSEVMQRIAAPMIGGILSALLLMLYVLPTVFYLIQRRKIND